MSFNWFVRYLLGVKISFLLCCWKHYDVLLLLKGHMWLVVTWFVANNAFFAPILSLINLKFMIAMQNLRVVLWFLEIYNSILIFYIFILDFFVKFWFILNFILRFQFRICLSNLIVIFLFIWYFFFNFIFQSKNYLLFISILIVIHLIVLIF